MRPFHGRDPSSNLGRGAYHKLFKRQFSVKYMIKYSVIIPVLNGERELPKLLDSIDGQRGIEKSELEVIIGLSPKTTDNTKKIAEGYNCVVVEGGMPAYGRNRGAEVAKGEFFIWKDADSPFPNDDFLSLAINEMNKRDLDVASTLNFAYTEKTGFTKWRYDRWIETFANNTTLKAENTNNPLMMNCMFAKRYVNEKIKGFREELEFAEDAEYAKRAKAAGFNFGILRECGKVGFSMRKLESGPLSEIKFLFVNTYFNAGRALGHEFIRGKTKIKYW